MNKGIEFCYVLRVPSLTSSQSHADCQPNPHSFFQGGSALSPAAVISPDRARQQAVALAKEVGCPTTSVQEVVSCLRQKPANILNDAQTKVSTGVHARWGGTNFCLYKWKTKALQGGAMIFATHATRPVDGQRKMNLSSES